MWYSGLARCSSSSPSSRRTSRSKATRWASSWTSPSRSTGAPPWGSPDPSGAPPSRARPARTPSGDKSSIRPSYSWRPVYSRTVLIDRSQIARSRRFIAAEPTGAAPGPPAPRRLFRDAGIYGLERIAASGSATAPAGGAYRLAAADDLPSVDWPSQDRIQVFEILSAYVRRSSRHPSIGPPGDSSLPGLTAGAQARRAATRPAARWARAMTDSIGLTPLAVGNSDASATYS